MTGFLSKLHLRLHNRKTTASSRQKTVWPDENDSRVFYHLRPRAKRITINIDAAKRQVIVTVPGTAKKLASAQRFVSEKYDWILVQMESMPTAQPFVDGRHILYRGEHYKLVCPGPRGRPRIDHEARQIIIPANPDTFSGRTKRLLIREAREVLTQCTHTHANALGKPVDKISVRDTSSRWGSCLKGNARRGGQISYSWRLVCAPPFVLDYVVAHECAHLVHANHGAEFWDVCGQLVESVKPAKTWLSKNGGRLHAVGAQH